MGHAATRLYGRLHHRQLIRSALIRGKTGGAVAPAGSSVHLRSRPAQRPRVGFAPRPRRPSRSAERVHLAVDCIANAETIDLLRQAPPALPSSARSESESDTHTQLDTSGPSWMQSSSTSVLVRTRTDALAWPLLSLGAVACRPRPPRCCK